MTDAQKQTMLQVLIGDEDGEEQSETLHAFLALAAEKILNRMNPYRANQNAGSAEVPERYVMTQLKIAAYLMNKRGAEGQIQHIENGIHRNYGDADVPNTMLAEVVPMIGIPE